VDFPLKLELFDNSALTVLYYSWSCDNLNSTSLLTCFTEWRDYYSINKGNNHIIIPATPSVRINIKSYTRYGVCMQPIFLKKIAINRTIASSVNISNK
jgi:hypothetical protein